MRRRGIEMKYGYNLMHIAGGDLYWYQGEGESPDNPKMTTDGKKATVFTSEEAEAKRQELKKLGVEAIACPNWAPISD
jgi:hypothetical protein